MTIITTLPLVDVWHLMFDTITIGANLVKTTQITHLKQLAAPR